MSNNWNDYTGLDYFKAMIAGETPHARMASQIPMRCVAAEHGFLRFIARAGAQQPGAAECCARLNFVPRRIRCVVVVSRECRGAKIDYFPSILIPGRNYCITQCSILLRILAQKLRHQNHIFE